MELTLAGLRGLSSLSLRRQCAAGRHLDFLNDLFPDAGQNADMNRPKPAEAESAVDWFLFLSSATAELIKFQYL